MELSISLSITKNISPVTYKMRHFNDVIIKGTFYKIESKQTNQVVFGKEKFLNQNKSKMHLLNGSFILNISKFC